VRVAQAKRHDLCRSVGPLTDEVSEARPPLKSGDVLIVAAPWDCWVLREIGPSDKLVDTF
jgi:hypothetical protein